VREWLVLDMRVWVDIETGSFGNAENIVFIDVSDWTSDELDNFHEFSDDDRSAFAHEFNLINEVLK
jgi:hypothetical protein